MIIRNKEFDVKNHTYVMGILNVTLDSFSDGARYLDIDAALFHAEKMIKDGADIIDVGGESTRPGHVTVDKDTELSRVIPAIEAIRKHFDVPVSLDTSKAIVAKEGLNAGADIINDVWGLTLDADMAKVVSDANAYCVISHNRKEHDYVSFSEDLFNDLTQMVHKANQAGIPDEHIVLDPGIGFCKTQEENLWAIRNIKMLTALGYPVLLGTSKKSVIGNVLQLPVEERLEGTLATTAIAVENHVSFVRVHDVLENVRFIKMMEAILNG